ncbi:hypothetical protein KL938_004830 [Ogataea parapolymorpha]|nr:hypothetical protein KL938_004830 [Ogataea parapolymorpha]
MSHITAADSQESRFSKYKLKEDLYKEPEWLSSGNNKLLIGGTGARSKKRSIPTTLIKRTSKFLGETNDDSDSPSQPALPFQSGVQRKRFAGDAVAADHETTSIDEFQDLPPKVSLYDRMNNDDSSGNVLLINNPDFGKFESDPNSYKNVFNRVQRSRVPVGSSESGNPELPFSVGKIDSLNDKEKDAEPTIRETAVIVYGYDDSQFASIVEQFSKYGTILEDFNQRKFLSQSKSYPVFIGPQWVKFTYDNSASAVRALRENNKLGASGSVIGVVPYTRSSLEKLLGTSIPDNQDIGCSMSLVKLVSDQKLPEIELSSVFAAEGGNHEERQDGRFRLKDGSGLINVPKTAKKENKGFLERGMKLVFGAGEV